MIKATSFDFRDIVLASHLKPLDKDEKIEKLQDRFQQRWNVCAGKNDDMAKTDSGQQLKQVCTYHNPSDKPSGMG